MDKAEGIGKYHCLNGKVIWGLWKGNYLREVLEL
jgi:hypothetical protein